MVPGLLEPLKFYCATIFLDLMKSLETSINQISHTGIQVFNMYGICVRQTVSE